MKEKLDCVAFNILLPRLLLPRVKKIAVRRGISVSEYLRTLIRERVVIDEGDLDDTNIEQ